MLFKTPRGGWALFVQVAIAFAVTVTLCIWQISRGLEKRELTVEYQSRLNQPPIGATNWRVADSDYRQIKILGRFDPVRSFVIENQYYNGAPGYWIVGVFNSDDGRFLVNRGWVPIEASAFVNPKFDTPTETIEVKGVIWPNQSSQSPTRIDISSWPVRLRSVAVVDMAIVTSAHAKEVRLIDGSSGAFNPAPLNISYPSSRHWSYAFQWLFIGCLVLLGYWYFVIKRQKPEEKEEE